ncbi:RNA-directed DNA polymerase, eukaryota, reverse transcriptase zinc-binding domain protein, partial [Tanacetum coccineum]
IYKIIAKILTNRLVGVLEDIVNEVQSAFISERQILDGPFILNEIMQWCRRRKKQSLIFKFDFEKAYDSVRWDFLDDILVNFGFGFRSTWTSIVQEVKKLQNQGVLKDVFPRLYALERHQNVTIHTKLIDYSLVNSFRRNPRSGVEEFQLDNLSRLVSTITLSSAVDRYVWSLENSGEFSVKSIRQVIDANCFPVIHSATRWVKSVPLKVNIMAWKIKMDGLPTRMNISRRGIEIDSIVCPICNSGAESSCHIFFQCNLVRQLARKISSWWNVDYVDVSSYEEWYTWLVSLRLQANIKAVRGFLITLFLILIIGVSLDVKPRSNGSIG